MRRRRFTALMSREDKGWVAHCPEVDVASQGATAARAKKNLVEAVDLFLECADPAEVAARVRNGAIVTRFEVKAR